MLSSQHGTLFLSCFASLGIHYYVVFEILAAVTVRTSILWDISPCRSSNTRVHSHQTTHVYIAEAKYITICGLLG
jgi:hypothetical protein